MHLVKSNPTPTETKLVIQASAEELQKAKDLVLKKLAPTVKVAGFRPGHVPPEVVEKNIDRNSLQTEVLEETINRLYASALRQENIRPVTNPSVRVQKFVPFTTLEFTMTMPTIGQIKLADYKKVKLVKKPVKVEAKDVMDVIESLRGQAAARKEVERAAKTGDEVMIDFKGADSHGQPVQGADGKDYPLTLGSNAFIPGFEENLLGLKPGQTKSFTVTFPKTYGVKALQGKKVSFEVTVSKVYEVVLPKVDDEFAAAVGPFKSLAELKDDIKKQLTVEREREAEDQFENELLETLANQSSIEIPELLVSLQVNRIEQEEKQNLAYRGQTWEEHLQEEGVTAEEHKQQKRPAAEQRVKVGILLSEIAEAEGISATPEETESRRQLLKSQYRDPAAQAELDKPEALRDIHARIVTEKTLDKLKIYAGAR